MWVPDGFTSIEFRPDEVPLGIAKRLVHFWIVTQRMFSSRPRLPRKMRRQGLGVLGRNRQLRIDRIKDEEPFVLDLNFVTGID